LDARASSRQIAEIEAFYVLKERLEDERKGKRKGGSAHDELLKAALELKRRNEAEQKE
jgi:hypothetical protein